MTHGHERDTQGRTAKFEPRDLSTDEAAVLALLLRAEVQGAAELREQAEHVKVTGQCGCGCPSVELTTQASAPKSPSAGRLWPAELAIAPANDDPGGEVILFLEGGHLSYLEYIWYTETPPVTWPPANRLSITQPGTTKT
jgi:hypothetical protein